MNAPAFQRKSECRVEPSSLQLRGGDESLPFLVIGYGNTLRGDDAAGPRVVERIAALNLPGVCALSAQQLSPEHAEPVSRSKAAVFVDAAVDGSTEVQLRPLQPGPSSQLMAHAADPGTILALARDVYGHVPTAWWLTVPAISLDFKEALSPATARACSQAVRRIEVLWQSLVSGRLIG